MSTTVRVESDVSVGSLRSPVNRAAELRAAARGVAFVEHEIENVQHAAETPLVRLAGGQTKRLGRSPDGCLGSADAMGRCGLVDQEGVGDVSGGEPPDSAQGQWDGGAWHFARVRSTSRGDGVGASRT
jgi:hypothetical protein